MNCQIVTKDGRKGINFEVTILQYFVYKSTINGSKSPNVHIESYSMFYICYTLYMYCWEYVFISERVMSESLIFWPHTWLVILLLYRLMQIPYRLVNEVLGVIYMDLQTSTFEQAFVVELGGSILYGIRAYLYLDVKSKGVKNDASLTLVRHGGLRCYIWFANLHSWFSFNGGVKWIHIIIPNDKIKNTQKVKT